MIKEYPDFECLHHMSQNDRAKREGKNKLSFQQWPAGFILPKYCGGPCKLASADTVFKIGQVMKRDIAAEFPLEDVLFTGIYRELVNATNLKFQVSLIDLISTVLHVYLAPRLQTS